MTSKLLYMVMHILFAKNGPVSHGDFTQDLPLCINRRAGEAKLLASITGEFLCSRSQYAFHLAFDHNGHTNPRKITMPGRNLTARQGTIVFLALMEYLTAHKYLPDDMDTTLAVQVPRMNGETVLDRYERYKCQGQTYIDYVEGKIAKSRVA